MAEAFLGLGGNVGDKAGFIRRAVARLRATPGVDLVETSRLYRSAPVGNVDQDWFLNAAARVETRLSPRELLERCLAAEAGLGRRRRERWGPRAIDIDLLLYDERTIREPGLEIPHPHLTERAFVLRPLAELAPGKRIAGRAVEAWLAAVSDQALEPLLPLERSQIAAILGASPKPERFAFQAQRALMEAGHSTIPISPRGEGILGVPVLPELGAVEGPIDTLAVYVAPHRIEGLADSVVAARPGRVIFSPGSESAAAKARFEAAGLSCLEDCPLRMLREGRF